ncbi:MAG: DUF695 domain-containing protein [Muribaculaceae bacterium]|nr:DUF695 domain-containing protein [Muribaculaceae bacterium]
MEKSEKNNSVEYGDWWTSPAESESGRLIMVTGRRDVDKFMNNPRFKIRVEATWKFESDSSGMPNRATSELMEEADSYLRETFRKDPVAVLTGVYTGDGERNWVFYTLSLNIFGRKFNEALSSMELLPITLQAEEDPDWLEYKEMKEASEIKSED